MFGLIGMEQAEREALHYFSLPPVIFSRLPEVRLRSEFANSSVSPTIKNGFFSFKALATCTQFDDKLVPVNGIGDAALLELHNAAMSAISGDYRAGACKQFSKTLSEFRSNNDDASGALGFIPCLSLLSLVNANDNSKLSIIDVIKTYDFYSPDYRRAVLIELDEMLEILAFLLVDQRQLFLPDASMSRSACVQIKAWLSEIFRFSKTFAPNVGEGSNKLLVAARALLRDISEHLKWTITKKLPEPEPVDIDAMDTMKPEDGFEEDEGVPEPVSSASCAGLISVVDAVSIRADTGLRRVAKEAWSTVRLDRLAAGVRAVPLSAARFEALAQEMPHARKLLLHIAENIRVSENYGKQVFTLPRPILLIGEPGVGKTHLCRTIADACEVPSHTICLAGSIDSKAVLGSHRSWSAAMPSAPVQLLSEGVYNSVLAFDEVDKAGSHSTGGDPIAGILSMIERSSSRRFFDQFLCSEVDVSGINYFLTSNSAKLPAPLLSRCDVFVLRGPTSEQYPALVAKMRKTFAEELQIDHRFLPALSVADLEFLQEHCRDIRALAAATRRMLQHRSALEYQGPFH